jgi:hypothetical protein
MKKVNQLSQVQKPHLPQANVIGRLDLCKKCQGVLVSIGTASNIKRCIKCLTENININIR